MNTITKINRRVFSKIGIHEGNLIICSAEVTHNIKYAFGPDSSSEHNGCWGFQYIAFGYLDLKDNFCGGCKIKLRIRIKSKGGG